MATNQPVGLTYSDRPEISETFADSVEKLIIDGGVVRIELVVNRMDDPRPPALPTGKKLTACRLILPINGFLDLANKVQGIMGALMSQGLLQQQSPQSPPTRPPPGKPN